MKSIFATARGLTLVMVGLLGLAAAGCGGDGAPIDAPYADCNELCTRPDGPDISCVDLATALGIRIEATSTACDTVADCSAVGNAVDRFGRTTCNPGIAFADQCYGAAVNGAAWTSDTLAELLLEDWFRRCVPQGDESGVSAVADCGIGTLACVDHHCTIAPFDCLDSADAGVK